MTVMMEATAQVADAAVASDVAARGGAAGVTKEGDGEPAQPHTSEDETLLKEVANLKASMSEADIEAERDLAHWFPAFWYGERLRLTELSGPPPKDLNEEEKRLHKQYRDYMAKERRGRDLYVKRQEDEAALFEKFKPRKRRGPRLPRFAAASREESKIVVIPTPQLLPPRVLRMRHGDSAAVPIITEPPAPKMEGPPLVCQVEWEHDIISESEDDEHDEHDERNGELRHGRSHGIKAQPSSSLDSALGSSPASSSEFTEDLGPEDSFLGDVPDETTRRQQLVETAAIVAQKRLNAIRMREEEERKKAEQARIARGKRRVRGRPRAAEQNKQADAKKKKNPPKSKPTAAAADSGGAAASSKSKSQPSNATRRHADPKASQRRFLVGGQSDATYTVDVTDCVQQDQHKPMDLPQRFSVLEPLNTAMATTRWEDEVLYDSEDDMDPEAELVHQKMLQQAHKIVLDMNDPHMVFDFAVSRPRRRVEYVLQQNKGRLRIPDWKLEEIAKAMAPKDTRFMTDDKFNLSNDRFYATKHENPYHWSNMMLDRPVTHANPALKLDERFFPTHLTQKDLRYFHRPTLRNIVENERSPLQNANLLEQNRKPKMQRATGTSPFDADDITAKTGRVVLAEYSEEHPFFIMRPGMCTVIRNFHRPGPTPYKPLPYGILIPIEKVDGSPFLGRMARGQTVQAFENNLFRAPAYAHHMRGTDFLVTRNPQTKELHVRYIGDIFVVGQLMPKMALPAPNSKAASDLQRKRLEAFVYRMFFKRTVRSRKRRHRQERPRVRMDAVKKAMPDQSDTNIRRVLKECAKFQRHGADNGSWEWKLDSLPTKYDLQAKITPEEVCAYESMLAAEQRLRDMGYKTALIAEAADEARKEPTRNEGDDDEDGDKESGGDGTGAVDEAKVAPWCLSQDFVDCVQSKCLLAIVGSADPTGTGGKLGMSYVRIAKKPSNARVHDPNAKKKSDDAVDLRKLPLELARKILIERYGMTDAELEGIPRWHVIGIVRRKATEEAKTSSVELDYARNSNSAVAMHRRKFESRCQAAFDGQNGSLASIEEVPSDDEGGDDEGGEGETRGEGDTDRSTTATASAAAAGKIGGSGGGADSTKQANQQQAKERYAKQMDEREDDTQSLVSESQASVVSARSVKGKRDEKKSKKAAKKAKKDKKKKKKKEKKREKKRQQQQQQQHHAKQGRSDGNNNAHEEKQARNNTITTSNNNNNNNNNSGDGDGSKSKNGGDSQGERRSPSPSPSQQQQQTGPKRKLKIYRATLKPEHRDKKGKVGPSDARANPEWFTIRVETVEDPRVISAYVLETRARLAEQQQHNRRYGVNAPVQNIEGSLAVSDTSTSAMALTGTKLRLNMSLMQQSSEAGTAKRGSSSGGGGAEQPAKRAKSRGGSTSSALRAQASADGASSVFGDTGGGGDNDDARSVSSRTSRTSKRSARSRKPATTAPAATAAAGTAVSDGDKETARGPLRVRLSLAGDSRADSEAASDATGTGPPSLRVQHKAAIRKLNETLKNILMRVMAKEEYAELVQLSRAKAVVPPGRGKSRRAAEAQAKHTLDDVLGRAAMLKFRSLTQFETAVREAIEAARVAGGPSVALVTTAEHMRKDVDDMITEDKNNPYELERQVVHLGLMRKQSKGGKMPPSAPPTPGIGTPLTTAPHSPASTIGGAATTTTTAAAAATATGLGKDASVGSGEGGATGTPLGSATGTTGASTTGVGSGALPPATPTTAQATPATPATAATTTGAPVQGPAQGAPATPVQSMPKLTFRLNQGSVVAPSSEEGSGSGAALLDDSLRMLEDVDDGSAGDGSKKA
ncbi:hypothetical protein PTSG_00702 [Salpingoeca rosetta]|uniref:Transcription initiation factor TFIID subunit 1 histone acetyltransferase domain-containing protein n=1 Tax=Salpingoeca rosetta (strain ATCC 50818 / BSB-021) TaxID=946362 RepID=F2TX86_SALR5|nr:uncharacterized protein PTSG_00702 [Salpingoeca rosetta]EGD75995.1 hypothetical protein PTSG_00702 [Salpingoeca rosetta]|eukprot:XP_004998170.1 hypothetical protein PTSG_00702 [Salpingoeca rosetta]